MINKLKTKHDKRFIEFPKLDEVIWFTHDFKVRMGKIQDITLTIRGDDYDDETAAKDPNADIEVELQSIQVFMYAMRPYGSDEILMMDSNQLDTVADTPKGVFDLLRKQMKKYNMEYSNEH